MAQHVVYLGDCTVCTRTCVLNSGIVFKNCQVKWYSDLSPFWFTDLFCLIVLSTAERKV